MSVSSINNSQFSTHASILQTVTIVCIIFNKNKIKTKNSNWKNDKLCKCVECEKRIKIPDKEFVGFFGFNE